MKKDIQNLVQHEIESQRLFNSPSSGELTFKEVIFKVGAFMHAAPKRDYDIIFGSDSQGYTDRVDFVSAIIVHRLGEGGIYFWHRLRETRKYVLRDRMYQEAILSMALAKEFMDQFSVEGLIKFNTQIHVDVGENGRTKEVIKEVVGMVRGNGFVVKTKPEAYGAASVADRHT